MQRKCLKKIWQYNHNIGKKTLTYKHLLWYFHGGIFNSVYKCRIKINVGAAVQICKFMVKVIIYSE